MNGVAMNPLKSQAQIFNEEGVLFFPQVFEGEELARLREACDYILEAYRAEESAKQADGTWDSICMRHLNDPKYSLAKPQHFKTIMETVADPRCLGPVEQIFRKPSLFRSTSLFMNPELSSWEGNWHRDHQFVLPDEDAVKAHFYGKRRGESNILEGAQFQIALVDNDDIEYVPFSASRYDSPEEYYYRCADERSHNTEEGMPNAMRIPQRAGDAIVFNPGGLHRGRYHKENPRRTLMLTYTPLDAPTYDYFSTQPWLLADGHLDGLSPRCQVYFQEFIDVYREFWLAK